jgi:hypothetical protein
VLWAGAILSESLLLWFLYFVLNVPAIVLWQPLQLAMMLVLPLDVPNLVGNVLLLGIAVCIGVVQATFIEWVVAVVSRRRARSQV